MQSKIILSSIAAALLLFACKQDSHTDTPPTDTNISVSDFEEFYKKFHEDTAFQLSRITFPLEGVPAFADSSQMYNSEFRWQRDNWIPHRITDSLQQNFTREFVRVNDQIIVEYMTHNTGGIGMERRFGKLGDGWNLIYYAGMNYIKR